MVKIDKTLCELLGGKWYDYHEKYGKNVCVGIDLEGAKLPEMDISHAYVPGMSLFDSFVSDSDFCCAELDRTKFFRAHFSKSDFSSAKFFRAKFLNSLFTLADIDAYTIKSLVEVKSYDTLKQKIHERRIRELIKQVLDLTEKEE